MSQPLSLPLPAASPAPVPAGAATVTGAAGNPGEAHFPRNLEQAQRAQAGPSSPRSPQEVSAGEPAPVAPAAPRPEMPSEELPGEGGGTGAEAGLGDPVAEAATLAAALVAMAGLPAMAVPVALAPVPLLQGALPEPDPAQATLIEPLRGQAFLSGPPLMEGLPAVAGGAPPVPGAPVFAPSTQGARLPEGPAAELGSASPLTASGGNTLRPDSAPEAGEAAAALGTPAPLSRSDVPQAPAGALTHRLVDEQPAQVALAVPVRAVPVSGPQGVAAPGADRGGKLQAEPPASPFAPVPEAGRNPAAEGEDTAPSLGGGSAQELPASTPSPVASMRGEEALPDTAPESQLVSGGGRPNPGLPLRGPEPDARPAAPQETVSPGPAPLQVPLAAEGVAREGRPMVEGARTLEAPAPLAVPAPAPPPAAPLESTAPAVDRPAPSVPWQEAQKVGSQVAGSITWMLRHRGGAAELQLHPENLGKVVIQLKVEGQEVHAKVWASEAGTVPLIQEHRASLEVSLQQQGLNLGSFDLQHGARQGRFDQEAQASRATFLGQVEAASPSPQQDLPVLGRFLHREPGQVEVYA